LAHFTRTKDIMAALVTLVGGGTRTAQRLLGPSTLTAVRHQASAPFDEEYEGLRARRIQGIRPHPDGTTQHILPGNYVIKKNARTGVEKRVFLEVRPESCSMSDGHDRLQC